MAIEYPTTIPSCIERGSLQVIPTNSVLRAKIQGPMLERNRYTSEIYNISWKIRMDYSELNIFLHWYYTILLKVFSFNFDDPITGQTREYFFIESPSYSHIGGDLFMVTFILETT